MFDHEYTLVAHPRLRARLSYRSADGDLAAATIRLDYRSDDAWTEEGTAVNLPEHPEEAGVEWQGFSILLYRDGDRVVAREVSSSLLSDAIEVVDDVGTVAPGVVRRGKDAAKRLATRYGAGRRDTGQRENGRHPKGQHRDGPVEMTQLDGTTIEALEPPAKATFEVYEGKDEKWRWRLIHDNGNVIADSGQGYASRQSAEKGIRSVKRNALGGTVERVGSETERDVRSASDADEGADSESAES